MHNKQASESCFFSSPKVIFDQKIIQRRAKKEATNNSRRRRFPLKTRLLHGKKFSTEFLNVLALAECVVAVIFNLIHLSQNKSHVYFWRFFLRQEEAFLPRTRTYGTIHKKSKVTKTRPTFVARRKITATLRVDGRLLNGKLSVL